MHFRLCTSFRPFCRFLQHPHHLTSLRFRRRATDPEYAPSEKVISVSEVLKEASELGADFVFTDNSDEPVFQFEDRLRADPEEKEAKMPEIKGALDPSTVDVTSAYSLEQGFKEISVQDLHEKWAAKEFDLLMDVREDHEYAKGRVPGATNTPLSGLNAAFIRENGLESYKNKPVAVICGIGKRSAQASVRLTKVLGFEDVTNVAEGTKAWIENGFEIEE